MVAIDAVCYHFTRIHKIPRIDRRRLDRVCTLEEIVLLAKLI
jgi:hypothetical protein